MTVAFDPDSTLIRRGRGAVTMIDMMRFVTLLEERPIATLLGELPGLALLSESKFRVATNILRRRFRGEEPIDRLQLLSLADEIADTVEVPTVAGRIRAMFRV